MEKPDPSIRPWSPAPWQSPDIEVVNAMTLADPAWQNVPWADNPNTLVARVTNAGQVDAPDVRVLFFVVDHTLGGVPFPSQKGMVEMDVPAGETIAFECVDCWEPPANDDPHYCVKVLIQPYGGLEGVFPPVPGEITTANNTAQSNYSMLYSPSASPATRVAQTVEVGNPLDVSALVLLRGGQTRPGFRTYIGNTWLYLGPGEVRTVPVLYEYAGDYEAEVLANGPRSVDPNFVHLSAVVFDPQGPTIHPHRFHPKVLGGITTRVLPGLATRVENVRVSDEPGLPLSIAGSVVSDTLSGAVVDGGTVLARVVDDGDGLRTFTAVVSAGDFVITGDTGAWDSVEVLYLGAAPYAPAISAPITP